MKVLISGAGGFIGKHLVKYFADRGDEVFALMRTCGPDLVAKNVTCIDCDISTALPETKLPKKVDYILHLAQSNEFRNLPAGIPDIFSVNVAGITRMLDYARRVACSRFLNFSTGSVYEPTPESQRENLAVSPTGAYPLSKLMAEQVANLYQTDFSITHLRLFFPYGPGQKNMLIPNIIQSVKDGREINLQGTAGGMTLSPFFINDICEMTAKLLQADGHNIVNAAGSENLNLMQLACEIGDLMQKTPVFKTDANAKPALFNPDLTLMHSLLPPSECTTVYEGLRLTIGQ